MINTLSYGNSLLQAHQIFIINSALMADLSEHALIAPYLLKDHVSLNMISTEHPARFSSYFTVNHLNELYFSVNDVITGYVSIFITINFAFVSIITKQYMVQIISHRCSPITYNSKVFNLFYHVFARLIFQLHSTLRFMQNTIVQLSTCIAQDQY